jgi:hypothetical protein
MITRNSQLSLLLGAALTLALCTTSAAADPLVRPRLENYSDYSAFLSDMAAYRKRLHDQHGGGADGDGTPVDQATLDKSKASSIAVATPMTDDDSDKSPLPPPPAIDPNREDAPPPIVINGPEDLDTAVEEAKSFIHPIYRVTRRFNRSTSQSFPLLQLDTMTLEHAAVGGIWYSPEPLPEDRSALDESTLRDKADTAEKAKQVANNVKATGEATDARDAQEATDTLMKALGAQPVLTTLPQVQTYFPGGVDVGHAAAIGITLISGTTTVRAIDSPRILIPESVIKR